MIVVYILIGLFLVVGIAVTILIIIVSLNNGKQQRIEQELLEKEFIEKHGREMYEKFIKTEK
jgi:ABC-type lipoprotein release transport system permease subunit